MCVIFGVWFWDVWAFLLVEIHDQVKWASVQVKYVWVYFEKSQSGGFVLFMYDSKEKSKAENHQKAKLVLQWMANDKNETVSKHYFMESSTPMGPGPFCPSLPGVSENNSAPI